jgi:hypothetical protein
LESEIRLKDFHTGLEITWDLFQTRKKEAIND